MGRKRNSSWESELLLSEVANYVDGYWAENYHPPTYRDIALGLKTKSLGGVYKAIHFLEKNGRIVKSKQTPGSLNTQIVPPWVASAIDASRQKKSLPNI